MKKIAFMEICGERDNKYYNYNLFCAINIGSRLCRYKYDYKKTS